MQIQIPAPMFSEVLMPEEAAALRQLKHNPDDYVAVVIRAVDGPMGEALIPGVGKVLMLQPQVVLPTSVASIPFSTLLGSDGKTPMVSKQTQEALPPIPPAVRFLIARSTLAAGVQVGPAPVPLPFLPPRQTDAAALDGFNDDPPEAA